MKRLWAALTLCFAIGCSAENNTGVACPALAVSVFLNYPASGSSNIVDPQNLIVLSGSNWTTATLTPKSGSPIVSTQTVAIPNPLPEPNTPLPPPSTAFRFPTLAAHTLYTVNASFPQSQCPTVIESSASFTTK